MESTKSKPSTGQFQMPPLQITIVNEFPIYRIHLQSLGICELLFSLLTDVISAYNLC